MKKLWIVIIGLVLLGGGCTASLWQLYSKKTTEIYSWKAFDRTAGKSTLVTFSYPSSFAIKSNGGENREKIIIGGLLGRIEIHNQDFYNIDNNDLNPARPNGTFKKGNFYAYIFHNRDDAPTRAQLIKIVNSIEIK